MPAYAIANLSNVDFNADIVRYLQEIDDTLTPFGGRFIVHGVTPEVIEGPWADATVIIVAQRVSTIVDADQILVLEDGRPVGLGPHAELVRTCPTYAEIVASQRATEAAA